MAKIAEEIVLEEKARCACGCCGPAEAETTDAPQAEALCECGCLEGGCTCGSCG